MKDGGEPNTMGSKDMECENLLIAGLGLLGGSVALAARERGLARTITALARPGRNHDAAVAAGVVDRWGDNTAGEVAKADFILLAQPVESIVQSLPEILAAASEGTVITDVGSTKGAIVEAASRLPTGGGAFVGSHPMAGSHLVGWKNARADLFDGRTTYITPAAETCLDAAARVSVFWEALGSRTVLVDPKRHDHLCALLSHVPHLAAVALVQLLEDSCEDPHFLRVLAGTGLRDTTRIAMGSPEVWEEICVHNSEEIAGKLRRYAALCGELAGMIESRSEGLRPLLAEMAAFRRKLEAGGEVDPGDTAT